jgi:hypothetical protein
MISRPVVVTVPVLVAGAVSWNLLPAQARAKALRTARRAAAAMAGRVAFWLWRETDASSTELDLDVVGFDWRTYSSEAPEFLSELEMGGIWAHEAAPLSDAHEDVVTEKLQAAGIHLDQEGAPGAPPLAPANRYVGSTSPQRLVDALSAALSKGRSGLIVDTNGTVVEIDQHPRVGAGLLILVDEDGARLLRSGTNRSLLQAVRVAADRLRMETARTAARP